MRNSLKRRQLLFLAIGLSAMSAGLTNAQAQGTNYPNQRISFVIGFAAGGFADTIGRWVAARLGERTGQTVVVQNMEGGVAVGRRARDSPRRPDAAAAFHVLDHDGLSGALT